MDAIQIIINSNNNKVKNELSWLFLSSARFFLICKQIFSGLDLFLQTLQADLGARVALLLQQHVSLSMENSKLKQKIARVQKEKLIMEGEFVFILL